MLLCPEHAGRGRGDVEAQRLVLPVVGGDDLSGTGEERIERESLRDVLVCQGPSALPELTLFFPLCFAETDHQLPLAVVVEAIDVFFIPMDLCADHIIHLPPVEEFPVFPDPFDVWLIFCVHGNTYQLLFVRQPYLLLHLTADIILEIFVIQETSVRDEQKRGQQYKRHSFFHLLSG